MTEKKWWPDINSWPKYTEEYAFTFGKGKITKYRRGIKEAISLLILENYIVLLNAHNKCGLFVICNDTFYPASADAEPLPTVGFGNDDAIWSLYDLVREHGYLGSVKWCSIMRGQRPLDNYIMDMKAKGIWCEKLESFT